LIDEKRFLIELEGEHPVTETTVMFSEGDIVKVRPEMTKLRWRRPHLRCPGENSKVGAAEAMQHYFTKMIY
jgi:hypothetical protein